MGLLSIDMYVNVPLGKKSMLLLELGRETREMV